MRMLLAATAALTAIPASVIRRAPVAELTARSDGTAVAYFARCTAGQMEGSMKLMLFLFLATGFTASAVQKPAKAGASTSAPTITITGCVQREVDVLRTSPGNLGLADEYVVTHSLVKSGASPSTTKDAGALKPDAGMEDRGATFGPSGRVYRLTGDNEGQLKGQLGQRVEIIASFDKDADAKLEARRNTASPEPADTPDRRPTAHDVPEVTIHTIRPLGTACPGTRAK